MKHLKSCHTILLTSVHVDEGHHAGAAGGQTLEDAVTVQIHAAAL